MDYGTFRKSKYDPNDPNMSQSGSSLDYENSDAAMSTSVSDSGAGASSAASSAPASGASVGGAVAASGGNPYVAGAMIAGNFLTNYLQARAADERQKRDMAMKTQENYAQNQNQALSNMMGSYRSALSK